MFMFNCVNLCSSPPAVGGQVWFHFCMLPEKNIFGRQNILTLLKRRVSDLKEGYRQNVALLGNQNVGKSTILENFCLNFDDRDVTVVYLDLESRDFNYFCSKFIGSLLYNYSKNKNLQLFEDINLLCENTKKFIPNTVAVIQKIQSEIPKNKVNEIFLGLLTLPEVFTMETNSYCVLILDEFQNIEEFGIEDVFQELGKKIMLQKRCLYIVSSSFVSSAQKILAEKLSLLFGNFETVWIEPFNIKESQDFIDAQLKEIKMGVYLKSFLADFTGGHPLCLNLICQELINLSAIHKQGEIFMPLLSQAIENTIFDRWGVLSRHYALITNGLCSGKDNALFAGLLMSLANGHHKISEMVKDLSSNKNQLMQKLNRLLELGIVVKNGNFYYIYDKLYKYWMKLVYQKRLKDVELAPDKQRRQFKEEFNRAVDNFKMSSRKNLSSRVMELFHLFDNEAFELNGRKYKLPLFREIVPLQIKNETGQSFEVIKGITDEGDWFIVLKKDTFSEADVHAITQEFGKNHPKMERCLIISLMELDENTRVKALQERFWIWNEGDLNTLLTLFDQPFIVK